MVQTLGMIKPSAMDRGALPFALQVCHNAGLVVNNCITLNLTQKFLEEFYEEHRHRDYFSSLVSAGAEGSSCILLLESFDGAEDAVDKWRKLIGPTDPRRAREEAPSTLRGLFGGRLVGTGNAIKLEMPYNGFHGSDSYPSYRRERDLVLQYILANGW
jgi:nucleoside-diphosphate kinase